MKTIFFLMFVIPLLSGCAGKRLELGHEKHSSIDRGRFEVKTAGTPRVLVEASNLKDLCRQKRLPPVSIDGKNLGEDLTSEVYCDRNQKVMIARFRGRLEPGEYRVRINSQGFSKPLASSVVFSPLRPEEFSEADRRLEGAKALEEGVNEGTINSSAADRTDWWRIEASSFSRFSIVFSHDGSPGELTTEIFRMLDGKLEKIRTLKPDQSTQVPLEGEYFFKVAGNLFGQNANYHIALRKLNPSQGAVGSRQESLPVLDAWPIDQQWSAVLLGVGTREGLQPDQELKVFSQNGNKLIDVCRIKTLVERESECHIQKQILTTHELVVRRSL
jgi:hypothetical protein